MLYVLLFLGGGGHSGVFLICWYSNTWDFVLPALFRPWKQNVLNDTDGQKEKWNREVKTPVRNHFMFSEAQRRMIDVDNYLQFVSESIF